MKKNTLILFGVTSSPRLVNCYIAIQRRLLTSIFTIYREEHMDIEGKTALVTGGGRGIGRATCLALARAGADVVINYRKNAAEAQKTAEEIRSLNKKAFPVQADVTSSEEIDDMMNKVDEEFSNVDILINNAGHIEGGPLQKTSEDAWERTMATHLRGPFLLCSRTVPYMIRQGAGKIINIGSTAGCKGAANLPYATAKGGIISFTQSLARDMSSHNILVNCVAPGPTITDFGSEPRTEAEKEKKRQKARESENFPLNRAAEPEEVADAVVFLVSHDYITGETLYVSGGCQTLYHRLMM